MFTKLLIANRGEIACRIVRTARRLGVRTVAVYSDADAGALHTRVADEAVRIGPASARESYLNIEALLRAARESGAEAIHPGYGFLAQSAELAEACARAGIVFVGPPPAAIRAMGVKDRAKSLMQSAGVPVVPGYLGADQSLERLAAAAKRIGFPLLVKAIAGGGGKGMRIVRTAEHLEESIAAARGEAERAFGDGRVMLERYVENARHVEVQVIADRHGNCMHLLERDCSLQRRYQKIIEEAPAPRLPDDLRARLHAAAVAAARAVDYENAGTVEFVVGGGEFYFLEMNTRLQVEHPVTEMILGIDLVEWQLRVAAGEPLPLRQDQIRASGHAIEARIYAEDPRNGFLPSGGRIERLVWPAPAPHLRIDAGVEEGDRVVVDYDALLAKLIVHAADRDTALARLRESLQGVRVEGVTTNLAALLALAGDPQVQSGDVSTRLIDERGAALLPDAGAQTERAAVLGAVSLLVDAGALASPAGSPWDLADGWSVHGAGESLVRLESASDTYLASVRRGPDGDWLVRLGTRESRLQGLSIIERTGGALRLTGRLGSTPIGWTAHVEPDRVSVWLDGEWHRFERLSRASEAGAAAVEGVIRASMPGLVLAVRVNPGDRVTRGQALVVLEAMKMEHTMTASGTGVVSEVRVRAGDRVREGDALLAISAGED
nr:MAG: 3-methylcrotonyl-CoA carboxylase [Pseudomonadota bacterium]